MSLFNSQTIFCILFSLLIGFGLYYYVKIKYRVLEISQREQAKVLQSVIMAMNTNNKNIMSIVENRDQDEIISGAIHQDMDRFHQVNSNNELIDVSDDSGSESSSDSDSSSESESSESDSSSESESSDGGHGGDDEIDDGGDSNKRKILFTNNESHNVEHLKGPDVKVIELSHPLYSTNSNHGYGNDDHGCREDSDDDNNDDDDEESDSESVSSEIDGPHQPIEGFEIHEIHEIHEIKENDTVHDSTQKQHVDLETDSTTEVTSIDNSLDNLSVKTVFKNKDSETHTDYNTMNVQSLRQLLKNKLTTSDGSHMSESAIHKLTKKELIKHLS